MARKRKEPGDQGEYAQLLAAFQSYRAAESAGGLLEDLNLVGAERRALLLGGATDAQRLATNRVLDAELAWLDTSDDIGADVLRRRYLNEEMTAQVALDMKESEDVVNRIQRRALEAIADHLWDRDRRWRAAQLQELLALLEASQYTELIGVDTLVDEAVQQLLKTDGGWITVLHGIGGIGKTAVADRVVRRALESMRFDAVASVRAETGSLSGRAPDSEKLLEQIIVQLYQALPNMPAAAGAAERRAQIARRLRLFPHLILIDNIEREEDTRALLKLVAPWAAPSKFVITTRSRPVPLPPLPQRITFHALGELADPDAVALLRHEALAQEVNSLHEADAATLQPILDVAGGNPLALKLTIGLATALQLSDILENFRRGRTLSVDEMYTRIYRAAWETLSRPARDLLEAMYLVSSVGATADQLQDYAGLERGELSDAIRELSARSLLEARGTPQARRYTVHRLTQTFVETDVIGWKV